MLKFTKMNGAGNDFVLLDNLDGSLALGATEIARLCDRHRGVGADGVLIVEQPTGAADSAPGADFRMRYYNADGGEAEMCGNGARCFARYAGRATGKSGAISFETQAGVIRAEAADGDEVRLAMSAPHGLALDREVHVGTDAFGTRGAKGTLEVHAVNTGVPHAVVFVEDLEGVDVRALGSVLRHHEAFAPKGTNVNFAQMLGAGSVAIRTYERGVEDETLACGTGVVACALIAHEKHGAASPVSVRVRGGDTLSVSFTKMADGYRDVTLTGPADFVFDGEIGI